MTNIKTLIDNAIVVLPFESILNAKKFLDKYSTENQLALISALYIGRDHSSDIKKYDRFYVKNNVKQEEYTRILYEKGNNAVTYFRNFLKAAEISKFNLENF